MNDKEAYNKLLAGIKVPRELIQDTRDKVLQEKSYVKKPFLNKKPVFAVACILFMAIAFRFIPINLNNIGPSPVPDSSMTGPIESKTPSAKVAINLSGQVKAKMAVDEHSYRIQVDELWYSIDEETVYINPYGQEEIEREIKIGNFIEGFKSDDNYIESIYRNQTD